MFAPASRIAAAAVLLAGLGLAQQEQVTSASVTPAFHAQTDLVTVPFQVRRGSRSASDLKPSDVVLLEDGVPRGFTIFEPPPVHPTLDIVVIFDVTVPDRKTLKVGFWDAKALEDMAGYWSEAVTRRLLDEKGATVRFSIYRFDQSKLQRLCESTNDPKILSDALHRLSPSAAQNVDVPLPAGLAIRAAERKRVAAGRPPQPSSLAAALSVLRDSGATSSPRALVIFSTGAEGTSLTPDDLADQAIAAGVPVYPVALLNFLVPILAYDGYRYDGLWEEWGDSNGKSMWGPGGPYRTIWGPADRPNPPQNAPPVARYFNYPFEVLGDLTGGLHFEAANHSQPLGESGERFVLDATHDPVLTMTGGETDGVLERVKRHALARFSSSYTVGFVPSASDSPRDHKLKVKLAPKTSGKVAEGERTATY